MSSANQRTVEPVQNVLFIMCDQLRWDAISCAGQGLIDTPNIDWLAGRGVRYDRAFVQGAVCGSSRMSYYTGRYVASHGTRWNNIPLSVSQKTLGDHVRPLGVRPVLLGKTHMAADRAGMARLGLDDHSPEAIYISQCGFEPEERDDGLHPDAFAQFDLPYNQFLRSNGFEGDNPWHSAANSVIDDAGEAVSGWLLRASPFAAVVPDELSETAYMTNRAIEYMRAAGDERWCLHLSFIKPHWPYVVSEPYHQLVSPDDVPPPTRSDVELASDHPVLQAFYQSRIARAFGPDHVRRAVYPAYLGLVKQIDDHLGRLFAEMKTLGRIDDTLIVFTSDHGDYLGDHWLGDKDWLHEEAIRVPMIVADPRPAADQTRGTVSTDLMEAVDIAPTCIEALGGDLDDAECWLEGTSLLRSIHSVEPHAKERAVCETDYGFLEMATRLPETDDPASRRATMLRTDRYKFILDETGSDLLFDLEEDPSEFHNRIDDPALAAVRADLRDELFSWYRQRITHTTFASTVPARRAQPGATARVGIAIGYWDEAELAQGIAGTLY